MTRKRKLFILTSLALVVFLMLPRNVSLWAQVSSIDVTSSIFIDEPRLLPNRTVDHHLDWQGIEAYSRSGENHTMSSADKLKFQHTQQSFQIEEDARPFFSSCLLVMDENHRLPEWIAYHYFSLPLRHLVVMVDPASETTPNHILERWKPYLMIEVWSDERIGFRPPPVPKEITNKDEYGRFLTQVHFSRQKFFYQECAFHLRRLNRTWTTFHDADEYLYIDPEAITDAPQRMAKPGYIQQLIRDVRKTGTKQSNQQFPPSYRMACIMAARTYFGATESSPEIVQKNVPSYLNGSNFETLRYLYRTRHDNFEINGRGKSLVHVSAPSKLEINERSVHNVAKKICRAPKPHFSPIRIRHYLGSWEVHSSRTRDPRMGSHARNFEYYEYRSQLGKNAPPDDHVRSWISGFCGLMENHTKIVRYLLQGTGELPASVTMITKERAAAQWSLSPFVIEEKIDKEGNKPGSFGHYLKQHYDVTTLRNGTLVAMRKTPI